MEGGKFGLPPVRGSMFVYPPLKRAQGICSKFQISEVTLEGLLCLSFLAHEKNVRDNSGVRKVRTRLKQIENL